MVVSQFGSFMMCAHSFCVDRRTGEVFTRGGTTFRLAKSLDEFLFRHADGDLALRVSQPWQ